MVNRSDKQSEIGLDDIEKAVGAEVRHVFPSDYRQAMAAMNKGQPLARMTQGRLPESFHAFARELTGQRPDEPTPELGRSVRLALRRAIDEPASTKLRLYGLPAFAQATARRRHAPLRLPGPEEPVHQALLDRLD